MATKPGKCTSLDTYKVSARTNLIYSFIQCDSKEGKKKTVNAEQALKGAKGGQEGGN